MKNFITFIVCLVVLGRSEADDFRCKLFDGRKKTLEYYCQNFKGIPPDDCSTRQFLVTPSQVVHLKMGGCDRETIAYAVAICSGLRSLDISYSGFKSLDAIDFSNAQLEKLNAFNNELLSDPWSSYQSLLKRFPKLIELDLSHNKLSHIESFDVAGAANLKTINLSHNKIQFLNDESFEQLPNLELLDLSNNEIGVIKPHVYFHLKNLKVLHLQGNPIEFFDCENFLKLKSVAVYLSWRSIKYLNTNCRDIQLDVFVSSDESNERHGIMVEGIWPVSNGKYEIHCNENSFEELRTFRAGNNRFKNVLQIMRCFGELLEAIYLDGNSISALNRFTFENFTNLYTLSVSDTNLTVFDIDWLDNQQQLRQLDVSHNQLKCIDNIFYADSLKKLIELTAAQNDFENVPDMLQNLPTTVATLDVSGNFVGKLNATTFEALKNLVILNLSDTQLTISDFSPFDHIPKLEILDLSLNNLAKTDIRKLSFKVQQTQTIQTYPQIFDDRNFEEVNLERFRDLRILNLSSTNLAIMDLRPFRRLIHLDSLDLSNNNLYMGFTNSSISQLDYSGNFVGQVNADTFAQINYMRKLKLRNTGLIITDSNPFEPLTNLGHLDISQNNLERVNFSVLSRSLHHLLSLSAAECQIKNTWEVIRYLGHNNIRTLDLSGNFVGDMNAAKLQSFHFWNLHLNNANISFFNFDPLNQWPIRSFKIANNELQAIDFNASPPKYETTEIDLEGNELVEIRNLNRKRFPVLQTLNISKNRLSCDSLQQLVREWDGKLVGNPWNQKHGENCRRKSE